MNTSQLDLRELLSFRPQGGSMSFLGQRVLLSDILSHGAHKLELINSLGVETTRTIITRAGFARGWLTGERLKRHFPEAWADAKQGQLGPMICSMYGFGEVLSSKRTDGKDGKPLVESFFTGSYEAEQHLRIFGQAKEVACWENIGFASGYVSNVEGQTVYFIEQECQAKGDAHCHLVGRYVEEWGGEITPFLKYFNGMTAESIREQLYDVLKWDGELLLRSAPVVTPAIPNRTLDKALPISNSPSMNSLIDMAQSVAKVSSSILVTGESGVGKDKLVQLIHRESKRSDRPLVAINCGALTESLIEGELFGYVKGAYTGADHTKTGLIEAAHGGTLFLDEIGDLPLSMQVKLLRVLQEREVRKVGDTQAVPVDIRLISATNKDLEREVEAGRFRRDLYYRLKVIEIQIPPLRERTEDILPLSRFYLARFNEEMEREFTGFHHKTADLLLSYPWPGNVRELVNAIERCVVLGKHTQIMPEDLPEEIAQTECKPSTIHGIRALHDIERDHILSSLKKLNNNKTLTAEQLGMSLATLYRKLKEYDSE
ncbi:AAA family ATPase [Ferrimonas sediminicola]|uniref:AAA family ATPase n=1 Tax=Ferrimonas sediminicola TaxID=2569538 RepID=A0A4U1B6N2_9GAMM|nr:sigma-54-dependent Fis family transcriptional regulator [Ferrimonas sediminicola]TKB46206.1 AAA family ATPase [Ferrimonas sediminicola]